ncbi:SDR family oxidoreductase [Rhodococcus opacus]|uniref:SDR family oxidoreductase n=1 Tax=Rhodococcus opacus TaxID=37919 RepID=A0AAX3YK74_RHOOP|nr:MULTISPECIES: SDR family oxidoreductase [Rhodococcus]MBA8958449.1 NAD(P)-dependent dehydrogenase (short-subunit alcohol dehydrogenase family) [Rhodococcus opacus]MBP2204014.1 NAD(P)-dependent dehydrogenase (short-subunit alcohol dehydrogenase family) [Rhodococcus opacus]MCZ4587966.1 SDR family oxidoreductase [Rhodococcus opacus]MDI9937979.1 SDR family oxidoreductase [Rhodococcus sp. IEGM 1351]MDV6243784.1 SDR family oxidoreductase [Rhodococcus opacus]
MVTNDGSSGLAKTSVLVTGGGSGIGLGVATALAAEGVHVTICGRSEEKLTRAAEQITADNPAGTVDTITADVTNEDDVIRAVAKASERTGQLDGVVTCAGGNETVGPVTQLDVDAWRRTVDLNLTGTMLTIKHSARALVAGGGGSIVTISSIASSNTHRWFGAYGPSKAGVDNLTQLAADELGASNVRVNCIRPGLTRTDLVALITDGGPVLDDYMANTPIARVGEVTDIAALAKFLLGPDSTWITGQIINVDGGQMLRRGPDFTSMFEPMFGADGLRGVVAP